MDYRVLIMLVLPLCISGCVTNGRHHPVAEEKVLMKDIYAQSVGDAEEDVARFVQDYLKEQKTFGYVKPYIPVVQEPVVRKIWIPDHKSTDADILVGGHWVYMMIQSPQWFTEQNTPQAQVPIIVPSSPKQ